MGMNIWMEQNNGTWELYDLPEGTECGVDKMMQPSRENGQHVTTTIKFTNKDNGREMRRKLEMIQYNIGTADRLLIDGSVSLLFNRPLTNDKNIPGSLSFKYNGLKEGSGISKKLKLQRIKQM
jgi:hypothetical protein